MPGRAIQADRLQFLFHALVVLDLCWDRNGHRGAAVTANKFNRLAAWMKEEAKELVTEKSAVRSVSGGFIHQRITVVQFNKKSIQMF